VLYPLYVETDSYRSHVSDGGSVSDIFGWIDGFLASLGVSTEDVEYYFSGGRSIHAHIPYFVRSKEALQWIKAKGNEFCEETGASLNLGIYSRKRLFRLPDTKHEKTGLRKTQIDHNATQAEIGTAVGTNELEPQESYQATLFDDYEVFNPVSDEGNNARRGEDRPEWTYKYAYSPYALAGGGDRSVAVLRKLGPAYCLREQRSYALLPVHVYGLVGCSDGFTKEHEYCPLQLSKRDYDKLSSLPASEPFVIIGGQSRNSKVIPITDEVAEKVAPVLLNSSREDALSYLQELGYETGSSNRVESTYGPSDKVGTQEERKASTEPTQAQKLKRSAERGDFGELTHDEKVQVAGRLLHGGREYAHNWIERNMRGYDYETTETFLTPIYEANRTDSEP
jgi:hypothetical protein